MTPPIAANFIAIAITAFGIGSLNPLPTIASGIALIIIVRTLWLPRLPPVPLFASTFQWLQVAGPIFSANLEGKRLSEDFEQGIYYEYAAWLSLAAIVTLSIGMRLGIRNFRYQPQVIEQHSRQLSLSRLFVAYLFCSVLSTGLTWLSWRAGGLRQPLLAFASIKWIPVFLIFWATTYSNKPKTVMLIVLAIEVIIGFSGFFSGFKNVLFVYMIAVAGVVKSLMKPQLLLGATATLVLALFWQAIKNDYRNFLNQGTGMQEVSVPVTARIKFLMKAATTVSGEDLREGFVTGFTRLGYIGYFAHSLNHVPRKEPHQGGNLWLGAIKHFLMPRFFFPDKPEINESKRTQQFTGMFIPGSDRGTSISIGYVGESYIDFGYIGMFVPIFLLGYLFGRTFRFFLDRSAFCLLGLAISTTILLTFALNFGASNISMIGGFVTAFIAYLLMLGFLDKKIWRWIAPPDRQKIQPANIIIKRL